ncbi:MAG: acyltransferase [Thermofilaceae archaeon]
MANYYTHPTAIVEEGADVGIGTKIWHFVHVRKGAKLGPNCNVGKCVYIDSGAAIGKGVKIQNFVSVYKGVTIEDEAFLGPSATLTNDRYPRAFSESWELVPTIIEEGASIGANATIVCGVKIGKYAMVGAGSVVTKDVPPHGLVLGNPAKLRGFVCYCGRTLRKLETLRKQHVVFRCEYCGREIEISMDDYLRLVIEKSVS